MADSENADPEVIYLRNKEGTVRDQEVPTNNGSRSVRNDRNRNQRRRRQRSKVVRQYACESCDRSWWSSDPKLVSTCNNCFIKYDPVPEDMMFGWAQFECRCGNKFSGFGQMNSTASECYESKGGCGRMVYPTSVKPHRRRDRRSETNHSCDAPDCFRRKDSRHSAEGPDHSLTGSKCVHPKSRKGKKKRVIYASAPHGSRT